MQKSIVFLILIAESVVCLKIYNVIDKFDNELIEFIDKQYCDDKNDWLVVNYADVNISSPNDKTQGLKANGPSCLSFVIRNEAKGNVKLLVYTKINSKTNGIKVIELDDKGKEKFKHMSTEEDNIQDWTDITLPIEQNGTSYINILGSSENDDLLIIDSIKFETEKAEQVNTDVTLRSSTCDGTLSIWWIALICVGSITAVMIVAVVAFHAGKFSVKKPVLEPELFDTEPPILYVIPRARPPSYSSENKDF